MTELGKLTGYKSKSKGIVHVSKEGKLIRNLRVQEKLKELLYITDKQLMNLVITLERIIIA